jgi:flagellar export protein FliJ
MRNRESLIRLHRFQVDEKRRKLAELEMMLADFHKRERELDAQVQHEQKKAGISDTTHFAYPMFAKSVIRRRDNILNSIKEISQQLEGAKSELSTAIQELKKYEVMQESRKRRTRKAVVHIEQAQMDAVRHNLERRR